MKKQLLGITLLLSIAVASMIGCKKDETSSISSTLTEKGGTWNCTVTQDQPAYLQMTSPILVKPAWFTGPCYPTGFDFGTGAVNPLIYTNKDTMNIGIKIHVNQVFMRRRFYDDLIDYYYYIPRPQASPAPIPMTTFPVNLGPGDYTFNVNVNLPKLGLANITTVFNQPYLYPTETIDTTRYNYDIIEVGIHDGKTNQYTSCGFVAVSDK
ncbi:MAG: hypothetical protein RLZZ196_424 [Bacteroidota bacterium]|jgi:hypothetical protein